MGKGKRNKALKNAVRSPEPKTESNDKNNSSYTEEGHEYVQSELESTNGIPEKEATNEEKVIDEHSGTTNSSGSGSDDGSVLGNDKGLMTALASTPVASCHLASRSLMLLEHVMLNDQDGQVRKRALEAYAEIVKRESEIALHEERSNKPGTYTNMNSAQLGSQRTSSYYTPNTGNPDSDII